MRIIGFVAAATALAPQAIGDSIFNGLSDYEEFRTYPYIDKAYHLQQEEQYQAALKELDIAIKIAREHVAFYEYAFELALAGEDLARAQIYLQGIPLERKANLHQRMLRKAIAREVPAATSMLTLLQGVPAAQQQELIEQSLYQLEQSQSKQAAWQWLAALPVELYTPELHLTAARVAADVGEFKAAVGYLQQIPASERVGSDDIAIARMMYDLGDLAQAETAWQAARQEQELDWWLLVEERAYIYRKRGQLEQLEALYREAVATYPDNKQFQAELAFTIYERDPVESAPYFETALCGNEANAQVKHLHQAAFAFDYANDAEKTQHYVRAAIDKMLDDPDADELQLLEAQRLHRDVSSQWSFNLSGWAGDSSRAAVGQGVDAQGDYFMQLQAAYAFTEEQSGIGGLGAQISLLQGGEDDFFETQEIDLGVTWRPTLKMNTVFAAGVRQQLDGDEELKPYLRASIDLLSPWSQGKWWKPQQERFWYNTFYLDGIYYPEDDQHAFFGRIESGPVIALTQTHLQTLRGYGFLQADTSKDLAALGDASDTRAGLGVGWMSEWWASDYNGYNLQMELGLEWQHVVNSDYAEDGDNAVLIRFELYF